MGLSGTGTRHGLVAHKWCSDASLAITHAPVSDDKFGANEVLHELLKFLRESVGFNLWCHVVPRHKLIVIDGCSRLSSVNINVPSERKSAYLMDLAGLKEDMARPKDIEC